jgi:hypothetical protein
MERCILSVSIPPPSDKFEPAASILDMSHVDIWQLDPLAEEFAPHISWGTAPARHQKLMAMDFGLGVNVSSAVYTCPSGAFSTFELACAGTGPCKVDFWQTRSIKSGTVYRYGAPTYFLTISILRRYHHSASIYSWDAVRSYTVTILLLNYMYSHSRNQIRLFLRFSRRTDHQALHRSSLHQRTPSFHCAQFTFTAW